MKAWRRLAAGLDWLSQDRVILGLGGFAVCGHASIQNLRWGHYELTVEAGTHHLRVAAAFDELAEAI